MRSHQGETIAQQNAAQQPIISRLGNNLTDTRANRLSGMVISSITAPNLISDSYSFDAIGNVNNRNVSWDTVASRICSSFNRLKHPASASVSRVF